MSNYIICNGELYHYGVPGMKWGQRKAQLRRDYKAAKNRGDADAKSNYKKAKSDLKTEKKIFKIDQNIERIELRRKSNREYTAAQDSAARATYKDGSRALKRQMKYNKKTFEASEVTNKYALARQKAKKDPSYKNSPEYQSARTAFGKQQARAALVLAGAMAISVAASYAQYKQ